VFVETDGDIEGLDVLRVCGDGTAAVGLSVLRDDFEQIATASELHGRAIFEGLRLPSACVDCPERDTCGGGYLPHRFSMERGFDNASIWCADILQLFGKMRALLAVSVAETASRRAYLRQLAQRRAMSGRALTDQVRQDANTDANGLLTQLRDRPPFIPGPR
jgi:uncharacterized protein